MTPRATGEESARARAAVLRAAEALGEVDGCRSVEAAGRKLKLLGHAWVWELDVMLCAVTQLAAAEDLLWDLRERGPREARVVRAALALRACQAWSAATHGEFESAVDALAAWEDAGAEDDAERALARAEGAVTAAAAVVGRVVDDACARAAEVKP
jgi:hypothetical protein